MPSFSGSPGLALNDAEMQPTLANERVTEAEIMGLMSDVFLLALQLGRGERDIVSRCTRLLEVLDLLSDNQDCEHE